MKIIILIFLVLFISTSKINPYNDITRFTSVQSWSEQRDGMKYQIWVSELGGVTVVNITKEKLEIELLRLQIRQIRGY